jgi:hypothetical protein
MVQAQETASRGRGKGWTKRRLSYVACKAFPATGTSVRRGLRYGRDSSKTLQILALNPFESVATVLFAPWRFSEYLYQKGTLSIHS